MTIVCFIKIKNVCVSIFLRLKEIQNACPSLTVYGNGGGGATIVELKEE